MAKENGTLRILKIVGLAIGIIMAITGVLWAVAMHENAVADNTQHIEIMEPDVKQNTIFRIQTTETLKALSKNVEKTTEALEDNTKVQHQILLELRK